jgi:hypothetical protein
MGPGGPVAGQSAGLGLLDDTLASPETSRYRPPPATVSPIGQTKPGDQQLMSTFPDRGCAIERAANDLRVEILADMDGLRAKIGAAVAGDDREAADRLRVELLACGDLLGSLAALMERHEDEHPVEGSAQRVIAELSLARAAIELELED